MIRLAVITAVALLAGCAASPPVPVVQEVRIPVPVPCTVDVPERPVWAVDALPIGSGIWDQMRALRQERHQRQAYEIELEAAVRACQ